MAAKLFEIIDPRDTYGRMRKPQLIAHAKKHGVTGIDCFTGAIEARILLRQKGIPAPSRNELRLQALGSSGGRAISEPPANLQDNVNTVDAEADMLRQFAAERAARLKPKTDFGKHRQEINFLRAECRRLNIKMERRDNIRTMRAKVEARKAELAKAN